MEIVILHAGTAAAVAAAMSQQAQIDALEAPFAGGDVRARIYAGSTPLRTLTLGPWVKNTSASPRRLVAGTGLADAPVAAGVQTRIVFETIGGVPVFEATAGATSSGAGVNFQYGPIRALCRPTLPVEFTADAALPTVSLPSWVTSQASDTWVEVPMANTLASLDPAQNPALNPDYVGGSTGNVAVWNVDGGRHPAIMGAWNGASFDFLLDEMQVGPAGGHSDYGGNEIYRAGFMSENPAWRLVRPPSGSIPVSPGIVLDDGQEGKVGTIPSGPWAGNPWAGAYADGRPRSPHTYNSPFFWPTVGHGQGGLPAQFYEPARNTTTYPLFFDEDGEHVIGGNGTFNQAWTLGMGACYDSSRDCLWVKGNGNSSMYRYSRPSGAIQSGSLVAVGGGYPLSGDVSMVYLPEHDCILVGYSSFTPGAYGLFLVFDCATGQWFEPTVSGSGAVVSATYGRSALHWVPSRSVVCLWNNTSNRDRITTVTLPPDPRTGTLTVSTMTPNPANAVVPSAAQTNGTYGRFAYSPQLGGFLLVNATSGPVYFYKL